MRVSRKSGFTIIETMLFLAITGLLVVSVLVGTGVSINRQRYRDSVTSLQSLIQQQYSEVSNVNNGRDTSWSCDSVSGTVTKVTLGSGISRGQSNCVLLGRLITVSTDGGSVIISDVVGSEALGINNTVNDIEALKQYNIHISPVTEDIRAIEWGSRLVSDNGETAVFSVLILQSPVSGIIRTFSDPNSIANDEDIKSFINEDSLKESLKICIDSKGLFMGTKMAIVIKAGASSAAGVETLGELSGC